MIVSKRVTRYLKTSGMGPLRGVVNMLLQSLFFPPTGHKKGGETEERLPPLHLKPTSTSIPAQTYAESRVRPRSQQLEAC